MQTALGDSRCQGPLPFPRREGLKIFRQSKFILKLPKSIIASGGQRE